MKLLKRSTKSTPSCEGILHANNNTSSRSGVSERDGLMVSKYPFEGGLRGMILFLFIIFLPFSVIAQQQDSLQQNAITPFLKEAAQNNPALRAQFRQYLSALEQVPQISGLPDPELSFGYFISPIETRVGPQQARFGLTQMFPWFGTLGARGDAGAQMAKAKFEAFRDARNLVFYEVHRTWYQLYHVNRSIQILQENIEILETLESLATQRYENDQVSQVDVLRVQIEKEDLKTKLELMRDDRIVAIQQFNELLNRPEGDQISIPDSLPAQSLQMSMADLEQAVIQQNPKLAKEDYEASSARSSIEAARKDGLPKFGLGLDYIVTGERDMIIADNGQDAILARGGIQIPLYRKKYRAKERQAQIELRAAQDRHAATENRLQTQLKQSFRDYYDGQRRIKLYKDIQIQRTRQAIDILTEEYATAATDFEELLRLQRKLLDYELARTKALVDQNTALAFIEYLYGKYNVNPNEIETIYGLD